MDVTSNHVRGIVPMLQDRFPNPNEALGKGKAKVADNRSDWEKAVDCLHFNEDGNVYSPAEGIEKCIQHGAKRIIKKGRTTWVRDFETGIIVSTIEPLVLVDGEPIHRDNLEGKVVVDARAAINHNAPGNPKVWKVRAKIPVWEVKFESQVINPTIPFAVFEEALILGGLYNGLGAYRTSPRFSKFDVVSCELIG